MRGRAKEWNKLIVPVSLTILHHRRMVRELTKPLKFSLKVHPFHTWKVRASKGLHLSSQKILF